MPLGRATLDGRCRAPPTEVLFNAIVHGLFLAKESFCAPLLELKTHMLELQQARAPRRRGAIRRMREGRGWDGGARRRARVF